MKKRLEVVNQIRHACRDIKDVLKNILALFLDGENLDWSFSHVETRNCEQHIMLEHKNKYWWLDVHISSSVDVYSVTLWEGDQLIAEHLF